MAAPHFKDGRRRRWRIEIREKLCYNGHRRTLAPERLCAADGGISGYGRQAFGPGVK
ncbi:hypothetical protein [Christensenella intestinihominis]|uniref:hypothetical protein n=1 Tax=Christensenella intestinihominis TaxID=1851429 RepID=UPI001560FC14|nr:hypothetical protein [Christensenella intestinihominis]